MFKRFNYSDSKNLERNTERNAATRCISKNFILYKHQNVFAINCTSNLCISHIIYMTAMLQGSTAEEIFLSHVSAFDKVSNKFKNLQQICNN
jgi:hypothetical protein